jgi:carbamate kinase
MPDSSSILIALGGNAISPPGEEGNVQQQFAHSESSMRAVVHAVWGKYDKVVITHGNGPQVGNILLRSEIAAEGGLYPLPLDTCVSDSEGGMGYMIQQVLHNVLRAEGLEVPVASLLTQTVVDADDPAWRNPTKYIGQGYSFDQAQRFMAERGWRMKEDASRGWRRVVPSPLPIDIVEHASIAALLDVGTWVIAAGGGGIPVLRDTKNRLIGVEAVVDKDLASALLARLLGIDLLVILTGVDEVMLNFGKPDQHALRKVSAADAERHLAEGQFPPGSMGPKIQAAVDFVRAGGSPVLITSTEAFQAAVEGRSGTLVTND